MGIRRRSASWQAGVALGLPLLALAGALTLPSAQAQGDPAVVGQWGPVLTWPHAPIHSTLLSTGRVLFHGETPSTGQISRWNPVDNSIVSAAEPGYNLFCSGHASLSDGRIIYTGGQLNTYSSDPDNGLNTAKRYDPVANTWTTLPNMTGDRWYPTNTTLANGDMLVVSGTDVVNGLNRLPQVWQVASSTWRNLTNAQTGYPLYPEMFLAPNGRVFLADFTSRYLDTAGLGAWTSVATMNVNGRSSYGSAAMYAPGKILFTGGVDPPTATAEVIDLNQTTPVWRAVPSMAFARRQLNLTILPDGKLLATGGSANAVFSTAPGVRQAEMWNPVTETWATMASQTRDRLYHSVALLLPDARVLTAGPSSNAEVFSPPYLFKGARPTISSAPGTVNYGQTMFIGSAQATSVTDASFVRVGSVTHALNMDQRINDLSVSQVAGGVLVTLPTSANVCPPGYNMLFLLNGTGVPSVARTIRIRSGLASPWRNRDVGAVAVAGSATSSSGTYTIAGSGADLYNTADEYHQTYQSASGDCSITARVTSQGNTHPWAKAGVMIRETSAANSKHMLMTVTPGNGLNIHYRSSTGGSSFNIAGGTAPLPSWVRVTRVGNTFTGFKSSDGVNWTTVGSTSITMGTSVSVGLAVCSVSDGTLSTSVFDNVSTAL
jgi:hypothetical protein